MIDYLNILINTSKHGFSLSLFIDIIQYQLILFLPLIFSFFSQNKTIYDIINNIKKLSNRSNVLIFMLFLLYQLIGSKPGAGVHHLFAVSPFMLVIYSKSIFLWKPTKSNVNKILPIIFLSTFLTSFYFSGTRTIQHIITTAKFDGKEIIDDLKSIDSSYPKKRITMGFGSDPNNRAIWFRSYLQYLGHPLIIDPDGKTSIFNANRWAFSDKVDLYPGSIIYATRDIGELNGIVYASAVAPILSSVALSLASLNAIND